MCNFFFLTSIASGVDFIWDLKVYCCCKKMQAVFSGLSLVSNALYLFFWTIKGKMECTG
jgi:hypothetical protein